MKVVKDMRHDLDGGIPFNLNLEDFSEDDGQNVLFYGLGSTVNKQLQEEHKDYKRKVLLNLWSPCEWMSERLEGKDSFQQYEYFDEVYTICPYTIKWLREYHNDKKHRYIFHPYDDKPFQYINSISKDIDVTWFGGFPGFEHFQLVNVLQNYKHMIISKEDNQFVTHHNVSHDHKIELIHQAKISIIYNSLCLQDQNVRQVVSYPLYEKNQAFSYLNNKRVPQYKARMAESARARCVMIVVSDPWNVCEDFWVPDNNFVRVGFDDNKSLLPVEFNQQPDFIYTTLNNLESTINYVLLHYRSNMIQNMIESAYKKSLDHTPKMTYTMIKERKECQTKIR